MVLLIILAIIALLLVVFIMPMRQKHIVPLAFLLPGLVVLTVSAYCFVKTGTIRLTLYWGILGNAKIYIDALSVFFLLLINIAAITAFLFSKNYLANFASHKTGTEVSLHYLSYILLYFSMQGVVVFRDAGTFLCAWELMGISSFIIILLDGKYEEKRKAAIRYLVQMHIGFLFLVAAFALVDNKTIYWGFQGVTIFLANNDNLKLFALFFMGFGMKAGFVPLHSWLPDTYSATPGNVGGYMSGVVTKMGIYGLIRVLSGVQQNLFEIGIFLFGISVISGLFGIIMATIQKDIKRLLAYSSIENMGIIGIGLSLGVLGKYWDNNLLMYAGYTGALIHTFNHSLFKSVLFYSAGLVSKVARTQNMDKMGGVIKRMPYTSAFFLFGLLGICALPPLNGFVSEFILYNGLFTSIASSNAMVTVIMVTGIIVLALIGGLSVIAFSKAFGIAFLGKPRSHKTANIKEVSKAIWRPLLIPFVIGIFPFMFIKLFVLVTANLFTINHLDKVVILNYLTDGYEKLFLVNIILLALIGGLAYLRFRVLKKRSVTYKPTWGCGYTAGTVKQQYTSVSYVSDFEHLFHPLTRHKRQMKPIAKDEIFPQPRTFKSEGTDIVGAQLVNRPANWLKRRLFKMAVLQTGKLQHYVSYAVLFMVLIFVLTYFNLI